MENKNLVDISGIAEKFLSVESTVEGPLEASNGKKYIKAKFEFFSNDGFSGQSRAYVKTFFEDSHSLQYLRGIKCIEDSTPMKIIGARVAMPTPRKFYILDTAGERIQNSDGSFRKGQTIVGFFLKDENPQNYYNQQVKTLTNNNAWVEEDEDPLEVLELEEEITKAPVATKKPIPGKK